MKKIAPFLLLGLFLISMIISTEFSRIIGTSIECSMIAICYHAVLSKPNNILSFIPQFLNGKINKIRLTNPNRLFLIEKLSKPYLYCSVCLSGQIAMFSTLFINHYSFFNSVFVICLTIILTWKIQILLIE